MPSGATHCTPVRESGVQGGNKWHASGKREVGRKGVSEKGRKEGREEGREEEGDVQEWDVHI